MILPITAFSPGGQADFHAEDENSPQANVLHNCKSPRATQYCLTVDIVRGSWKADGL